MSYCSLDEAKRELKAGAGTGVDNSTLLGYVRAVSKRIDGLQAPSQIRWPYFEPTFIAKFIEIRSRYIDSYYTNALTLPSPLLSLTSITLNGSDIAASVEAYPLGSSPIKALRLTDGSTWYSRCSGARGPVYATISGLWGYHRDYAGAWVKYDDITVSALAPGGTSFTVADVDGDDAYGFTPRFSIGQLLRIGGGSEILLVNGTTILTNTVSVLRAQNGTSLPAGDYNVGDDVEVFQVEEPIRRVTARQAALFYARKGSFEAQQFDQAGITTYPQDLLTELRQTLTEYQYV
jgi:hypothetical protein